MGDLHLVSSSCLGPLMLFVALLSSCAPKKENPPAQPASLPVRGDSREACRQSLARTEALAADFLKVCGESSDAVFLSKRANNIWKLYQGGFRSPADWTLAGFDSICKASSWSLEVRESFDCNDALLQQGHRDGIIDEGVRTCAQVRTLLDTYVADIERGCNDPNNRAAYMGVKGAFQISTTFAKRGTSPVALIFAAYDTACAVARATKAYVIWMQSACSETAARDIYARTSADSCTDMNEVAPERRRIRLPSWCPDRRNGWLYCAVVHPFEDTVNCVSFAPPGNSTVPIVVANGFEFAAKPAGKLAASGSTTRLWREVAWVDGKAPFKTCYIPDEQVVCSQ